MTQPRFGEHLRYVGRDGATGLPVRVNDRFIAETEKAIERYGQDAVEPVPPPAPGPVDIASVSIAKLGLSGTAVGPYGLGGFGRPGVPQDTTPIRPDPAHCGASSPRCRRSNKGTRSRCRSPMGARMSTV